jgi:hypothetical protein
MCYEARIKDGRKVVFSLVVNSMDDALEWFVRFESKGTYTYCIIPKYRNQ